MRPIKQPLAMEKRSSFEVYAPYGKTIEGLDFRRGGLEKLASSGEKIPSDIFSCAEELHLKADPNLAYFLCRALGSGEFYGANNNGDYFPEEALEEHHPSFVKTGALYRHHKSTGPKVGDVLVSAYNPWLRTVDLVVSAPISDVGTELQRLASNMTVATSMGAAVPFDICNVCGNQARTRMQYCTHLRPGNMLQFFGGKQAYAINTIPRFKDISLVVVPAAPESCIFRSLGPEIKMAQIQKQIPAQDAPQPARVGDVKPVEQRPVIPPEMMRLLARLRPNEAVKTAEAAFGVLRPDEFTAILRKDASCLVHELVPTVRRNDFIQGRLIHGSPDPYLLSHIKVAQQGAASWTTQYDSQMARHELISYLEYRNASPLFERQAFLR